MLKNATETEMAKILKTLSNKDAIKILRFAKSGFGGSTDAHKKVGLSIKRYYYRLGKLVDVGLMNKSNNRYELTPLGTIVCDSMEKRVLWAIENIDQLQIVETLKASKKIDDETLEKLAMTFGNVQPRAVRVIQTYEGLVDTTVDLLENATEKYCLASRYSDMRAGEAGWRALKRGVRGRIIDGGANHLRGIKIVQTLIGHPKLIKKMYEIWHSDSVQIRYRDTPFSFMVVDDRYCCLEIINPAIEGFFAAIQVDNNEPICKKLIKTFDNLWRQGKEEHSFANLVEKLMTGVED